MLPRNAGTILNITSVTDLKVPPFPSKTVYHSNNGTQDVAEAVYMLGQPMNVSTKALDVVPSGN